MSDLVRVLCGQRIDGRGTDEIMRLAADEIESLRSRLAEADALLREARASIPCNAKFTLRRIDAFLATADSASGVQK